MNDGRSVKEQARRQFNGIGLLYTANIGGYFKNEVVLTGRWKLAAFFAHG